ncbi:probable E3 ubiquitin-protein ligase TRIML1 [Chanos chanos]|uniref:Probable E3 ubiquitin-protein ligase TRIML1 n=1 Tax=Chanos chanos TaxID=29144 RepID=A0A6J2VU72_CHACN|nr:probable E3 ubiquitin-protein ligase TRIML1 [Chanos chanos]
MPSVVSPSLPAPRVDSPVLISQHLKCSICQNLLKNPVTTTCGHTFCLTCLEPHPLICPVCKEHLQMQIKPSVNVILKTLVQELCKANCPKPGEFTGASGEVACDVCSGNRKLKAVKSCLVCLMSYCSWHVEQHRSTQRLRGHHLVAPVEDLDQRACLTHGRPLELYSCEEGKCICALCVQEGRQVVPVETERNRRQADLGSTKRDVEKMIQEREDKVKEIQHAVGQCQGKIDREKEEIKGVFEGLMAAVEEAQREALHPLEDRRRRLKMEAEELTSELKREISEFRKVIAEFDRITDAEDHVHFLQSHSTVPKLEQSRDLMDTAVDTELSFSSIQRNLAAMKAKIDAELEKISSLEIRRIQMFAVDVSLDPDTANAQLVLSDDGKEVRDGGIKQDFPDNDERYDLFGCVLGQNQLTSGRAYWEVGVWEKTGWDLGVAAEDANRKGKIPLKPSQGYWAIVHCNKNLYCALEDPPVRLPVPEKVQRVGVFVDYEEGLVSFYNVEARSHIYTFTDCNFRDILRPYFSPHFCQNGRNSSPLVICPVNQSN